MRTRSLAVVAIALAAVMLAAVPAFAAPSRHRPHAATAGGYVNPFTDPAWGPARTDMGVDWIPNKPLPVLAVGNAVVLGVQRHAPWPGGKFIYYQLIDGSHAGDIIYVAEHLSQM